MLLEKVDVRDLIRDHVATLWNYRTNRRSRSDLLLFFGIPLLIASLLCWKGVSIHESVVNALLTAFSIFVGLLLNLLLMVLTFLQSTVGSAGDPFLQIRKQLIREVAANLSFSVLTAVGLVAVSIVGMIRLRTDLDPIGPVETFLLITGSINFVLSLLMILRRIYALLMNEFDRHKILPPSAHS